MCTCDQLPGGAPAADQKEFGLRSVNDGMVQGPWVSPEVPRGSPGILAGLWVVLRDVPGPRGPQSGSFSVGGGAIHGPIFGFSRTRM